MPNSGAKVMARSFYCFVVSLCPLSLLPRVASTRKSQAVDWQGLAFGNRVDLIVKNSAIAQHCPFSNRIDSPFFAACCFETKAFEGLERRIIAGKTACRIRY